jgi:hypothetical protein
VGDLSPRTADESHLGSGLLGHGRI